MAKESSSAPNRRNTDDRISPSHAFVVGRFGIIFAITAILAVAIAVMLVRTTVVNASAWNRMAASTLADSVVIYPQRGEILASDGSILATNLYYVDIMVDFRATRFKIAEFVDSIPMIADSLSVYFPRYSRKEWERRLNKAVEPPKSKRTRNFVIAKAVPDEMLRKVKTFPFFRAFRRNSNCTGLKSDLVMKRSYPFGRMARLSIGRVGQLSYDPEVHGRSGLERALDTLLYGVPGVKRKVVSTRGTRYAEELPAIDGYDVTTTIDITMQDLLEAELGDMLLKSHADWGTAILMEVATGDIKAISNLERDSTSRTPRCIEALNRAVQAYEPGSVMKVMTMAVALEKGFGKPVTRELPIGHSFAYLGKRPISDTHSPASLPISRFIEYSSNIGMVKMTMPHYDGDPNRFKKDLAELGFFDRFNTGIAREVPPYFPTVKNNVGGKLDLSRMVFGYCTMIPPLYTCAFYNAVANDGRFVRPRLVKGLRTPDGRDSVIPVSYVRERMMSSENAALLRKMMRGVVWEQGGTAKSLRNDVVEIAGKTGTCKIALEDKRPRYDKNGKKLDLPPFKGGYLEGHYRVTFCGFFPYENPKYTCIVLISDPKVPYRGPAVSSGVVLKNLALKLYARGLLSEDPTFAAESGEKGPGPTVYSSFNPARNATLHSDLRLGATRAIRHPEPSAGAGTVPDVKGVSLREALATLEAAGYAVKFEGVGYVYAQNPEAGAKAVPGTRIHLALRHD
ncbi:MAG: transpeptidase family protein [Muribaculaceae bacterium]|nr:transpeptidase family protein [Muribaculaceae bacterium]